MMKKKLGCGRFHPVAPLVSQTKESQAIIFTGVKIKTLIAFATAYYYALNATGKQTDRTLTK